MNKELDTSQGGGSGESVEEMFVHLDEAKERYQVTAQKSSNNSSGTALQRKIRQRSDAAVLASNHEPRLK